MQHMSATCPAHIEYLCRVGHGITAYRNSFYGKKIQLANKLFHRSVNFTSKPQLFLH